MDFDQQISRPIFILVNDYHFAERFSHLLVAIEMQLVFVPCWSFEISEKITRNHEICSVYHYENTPM